MDISSSMNSTEVSDIVTSTDGTLNVILLCYLHALLKQWVSEESIGSDSTMEPDIGMNSRSDDMIVTFSSFDYIAYGYGQCANASGVYNYDIDEYGMDNFINCVWILFMKEIVAIEKRCNMSVEYDNGIKNENALTLISNDRIFYSVVADSLGLNDLCKKNTTTTKVTDVRKGMLTALNCNFYRKMASQNDENVCTSDPVTLNSETRFSYYECTWYRLLAELGAKTVCERILIQQASCDMYNYVMTGIFGGILSIIGIVCNIGWVIVFSFGTRVVKTPTIYQLRMLAFVNTIVLVMYFIHAPLYYIMVVDYDNIYWKVIAPYIEAYIWPVYYIGRTSSNWLTVFMGVYRYLAICKPVSNSYSHVKRNRRKYLVTVLSMAALCNIPYFFVHNLSQYETNSFIPEHTSFGTNNWFWLVYDILYRAFIVCIPVIILLIVIVNMIVVLRQKQQQSRNNDSLNTLENNINTVLITILITFLICQLPRVVNSILYFTYDPSSLAALECGSVEFYLQGIENVFVTLNSAANPVIYLVLRNRFTCFVRHSLSNKRAESIEMSGM